MIETEELQNVVLVGHSFGGFVITGVVDRMPEAVASLVYLDAAFAGRRPSLASIESSARYAKEHGWKCIDLETGHDAMVSAPKEVAAILLGL